MKTKRILGAITAIAMSASAFAGLGCVASAADDTYDDYGIGEVVFGDDDGKGTVTEETFDDYTAPTADGDGWSGSYDNVSIVAGQNIAVGDYYSDATTPDAVITGYALNWGVTGSPVKSFSSYVTHGIVKFSASFYQGTNQKAIEIQDSEGNNIVYIGSGTNGTSTTTTSFIVAGKLTESSYFQPAGRATKIYNGEIDLDKGTITFDAEYPTRSKPIGYSSTQNVALIGSYSTTFDNTDVACMKFDSLSSTNVSALADNILLYSYMPSTRHAVEVTVVNDTGATVEGATVTVDGYRSVTTDENGVATIYLEEATDAYTVTAEATGYKDGSSTVTSADGKTVTVEVTAITDNADYPVVFNVTNKATSAEVTDATVTITNTKTEEVSYYESGLTLKYGNYTYTVTADGYRSITDGAFEIESDPDNVSTKTVDVELDPAAVSGTVTYTDGTDKIADSTDLDVSGLYYGDSVTYALPKYIINDSKLYRYGAESGQQYTSTVEVSGESVQANVTAAYTDITSDGETPVYFADFGTGINTDTSTTEWLRCSGGQTSTNQGNFTLVDAGVLSDGIYTIEIGHYKNRAPDLYVGSTYKQALITNGNSGTYNKTTVPNVEITSEDEVYLVPTAISGYVDNIDYVLVIKTGDLVPTIEAAVGDTVDETEVPTIADDAEVKAVTEGAEDTTYGTLKTNGGNKVTTIYAKITNPTSGVYPWIKVVTNDESGSTITSSEWRPVTDNIYFAQLIGDTSNFASVTIGYDGAEDTVEITDFTTE